MNKKLIKTLMWINRVYFRGQPIYTAAITNTTDLWMQNTKNRGLRDTISFFKLIRLAVTRYLCGHPINRLPGIALRSDGLPRRLPRELILMVKRPNSENIRMVLTLLTIGRCFTLPVREELSSITDTWGGTIPEDLMTFAEKEFSKRRKAALGWTDAHWVTKIGPIGPSLATAMESAYSVSLLIRPWVETLGGLRFKKYFSTILSVSEEKEVSIRKLAYLQDKEGKTRVIAMLDWWSQTVLKKYHEKIMGILKETDSDFTYQGNAFEHLSKGVGTYYSFDLSNATDRFPLVYQKKVLAGIFGEQAAEAWGSIITELPFNTPSGDRVKYNTGQPMGAYSSWAVFALCHHTVLRYVRSLYPETVYAILGDDVVIRGKEGAEKYKELMGVIDVPISEAKTHISEKGFEFAKRWYIDDHEVSPFPINSVIEAGTSFLKLATAILDAEKKGWSAQGYTRHQSFSLFMNTVQGVWLKKSEYLARKSEAFILFCNMTSGSIKDSFKRETLESFVWDDNKANFASINDNDLQRFVTNVHREVIITIGDKIEERATKAIESFWGGRSDQFLDQVDGLDVPIVKAIRDQTSVVEQHVLSWAGQVSRDDHIPSSESLIETVALGKTLKAIRLSKIPTSKDATERRSVVLLRARAELMVTWVHCFNKELSNIGTASE